jgi:hypothetical protein
VLFSGKSVPLPHLPNPDSLRLVLFSYTYCVTCINFDVMWRAIFRSIYLQIPAESCALLFDLHQEYLYLLIIMSPWLSLSYSEGTRGGFSCNFTVWVFCDTLYDTATKSACQLTDTEDSVSSLIKCETLFHSFVFFTLPYLRHL